MTKNNEAEFEVDKLIQNDKVDNQIDIPHVRFEIPNDQPNSPSKPINKLSRKSFIESFFDSNSHTVDNKFEENLLDKLINEYAPFGWEHLKLIMLLFIYICGEGFIMIGISLIIPVITKPWKLTEFEKGFLGGSVFLGFTIGAILSGELSDRKGRRICFVIGNILSLIGGLIGIIPQTLHSLVISNFFIGLGIGIGIPSIFSLCTEITNSKIRSYILGWIFNCFVIGEFFGCYIAMADKMYHYENNNWKKLLVLRCVGFGVSIPLIYTICESPKFLLTKKGKRDKEAFIIVGKLLGPSNEHLLTQELKHKISAQYEIYMKGGDEKRSNFRDLFNEENKKKSIILFILWFIVSYVYYGLIYILPSVYQELALTTHKSDKIDSQLYDMIIADIVFSCIFEIPSNIANGILPNMIGRKYAIMVGFFGSGVFLFFSWLYANFIPLNSSLAKAFINISFGVLYTYTTENFPTYMRATGLGTCNFFSRLGGFTTPFISEFFLKIGLVVPFVAFCFTSWVGFLLTMLLQDTLGKTTY